MARPHPPFADPLRGTPPLARTRNSSRIESLSDGVFAFAATLLVVSLEVPRSFAQLSAELSGFAGFALSFSLAQVGVRIGMPGWIYALLGLLCWWHGVRSERELGPLREQRSA